MQKQPRCTGLQCAESRCMKKWTFSNKNWHSSLHWCFPSSLRSFSNLGPHPFAGLSADSRIWFLTAKDLVMAFCSPFLIWCMQVSMYRYIHGAGKDENMQCPVNFCRVMFGCPDSAVLLAKLYWPAVQGYLDTGCLNIVHPPSQADWGLLRSCRDWSIHDYFL